MNIYRLVFLTLLFSFPATATALAGMIPVDTLPQFSLSLATQPKGVFLPGDDVRLVFKTDTLGSLSTDSFTLEVQLPAGLILKDTSWSQQDNIATCKLAKPANNQASPVDITVNISPKFTGHKLTIKGYFVEFPDHKEVLTLSVYELLKMEADTCFFSRDTNLNTINTFLATRQKITARLRSPINLSPSAPLRISHGNCAAFILKPGKKKDNQKENCTALRFAFTGNEGNDYPDRYTPGPGKMKGVEDFISRSRVGDTISFSVKTVDGKPLRGIMLTDHKGEIIDAAMKAPAFSYETVLDTATKNLTLHLRARRILGIFPLKQYCFVELIRKPVDTTFVRGAAPPQKSEEANKMISQVIKSRVDSLTTWNEIAARYHDNNTVYHHILKTVNDSITLRKIISQDTITPDTISRDTISQDTCAGLFAISQRETSTALDIWVPSDTLLFQATDLEGTVVGLRNPLGIRQRNFEIKVPLQLNIGDPDTKDSLIALAYWIGIGNGPITAYSLLAEEVPPEWAQPGTSAPLAAYGLSHPVVLPGLNPNDSLFQKNKVRYAFVTASGRKSFTQGKNYYPIIPRNTNRPNYGLLSGQSLKAMGTAADFDEEMGKDVLRFYLAFANQHQINTFKLQLKIVAYYQVKSQKKTWVPNTP